MDAGMGALPGRLRNAFARGGEMGSRMLALDWSTSPLGPPAQWPAELTEAVVTMLASKAQIVIFWGPEYAALYNDAYRVTMGGKHPGHLARPGREMWTEVWPQVEQLFDGVLANDESFHATDRLFMIERYGFLEETYFDVSYDPIRAADGTVGGVLCIVTETTRRVLGERRVRTLSALGRRLADSPGEAALAAEAAAVLQQIEDVPYAALILDDGGDPPEAVRKVLESGQPGRMALTGAPPAAADEALILPIGNGAGTHGALIVAVSRFLAMDRDYRDFLDLAAAQIARAVANLRAYEHQRRRAAELAALDAAKTGFFSNVSHELRTPLTLILGPLEDLLEEADGDTRDRLRLIHRNGLRLLKLVNTVLDFSRTESGRMRATYHATDLPGQTARLVETFRPAVERAGLDLVADLPPLAERVYVDLQMWEKVVFNLLSNAVKFTRDGCVEVRLRALDGKAVLTVHDTGVGIDASELPYLFDRFHRVTGTWARSHEGTGIGLALVRELVELHGGTVGAQSAPGRGSVFTVTLPFGTAHLPPDRISHDETPAGAETDPRLWVDEATWWSGTERVDPQPAPGRSGGGRVLLVDDNADLREHVARLLRPHWSVTTATDGVDALEQARSASFDLVLTDVMMPRLDGFGLIAALRADERTRDLPIVVLSARAGEEAAVEGLAAGADDYLAKPFSARELTARARANLELGQLRRDIIHRLRALVDAAVALNAARTTAEVLGVAARHVLALAPGGRVVVTALGGRAEEDDGAGASAPPDTVLALPDTAGAALGELHVWSGPDGPAEPAVLFQLARLIGLRLANARLYEAEHRIASTLQHSLLPQSLPQMPGVVVASRYLAGSSEARVGGDWYDVVAGPDGRLFLVIGDVVGKGVQAAAEMGQLRNALRAYVLEGFDCGAALSRLNRLVNNLGRRQFATVVCAQFDPRARTLRYSSAGHPSPVLSVPGEPATFLHTAALGPPIGALHDVTFPTQEIRLTPGARLLLYTDGLIEDRDRAIDAGLADLTAAVGRPVDHIEDLLDALVTTAQARSRRDDVALLALEVTEPRRLTLRLAAEPDRLSVLRRRLTDFLAGHDVPEADAFDFTVAVSEAAANAVEHPIEPAEPLIVVETAVAAGEMVATVRDTGTWRRPASPAYRGRGLALIGALTEAVVDTSSTGTTVTLRRSFQPARNQG